ncbi:folate-biopterin transporter [Baffinella frigidus]|nr:folate-biopterin transporter [Cryptophyta sp. CCMP2293]
MQTKPHTGSAMVSYVWGCFQIGALIASIFVGPIADAYDPQIIFWVCIPLAASIMIPTSLGYLSDERRGVDWVLLNEHPYLVSVRLGFRVWALSVGLWDLGFRFYGSGTGTRTWSAPAPGLGFTKRVVMSVLAFCWLPPHLARCNFYMFMSCVLYINISGAQDFWFTADQTCVPGGPSFDYTYYTTYASLVGSITGWIGIVLFQAIMSDWNFRTLFWVTTVIQVVASMFDMVMIARINVSWGVSDKAFYMFGDAVIGNFVWMMASMPMLVLTSKLVPKGLEATTYALLAGFQNFGSVASSQIGIYASQYMGIQTTAPCNFENLNTLVLVCHCLLPLLCIPLTFLLIPNKKMTDTLIDEKGDARSDSIESLLDLEQP